MRWTNALTRERSYADHSDVRYCSEKSTFDEAFFVWSVAKHTNRQWSGHQSRSDSHENKHAIDAWWNDAQIHSNIDHNQFHERSGIHKNSNARCFFARHSRKSRSKAAPAPLAQHSRRHNQCTPKPRLGSCERANIGARPV